MSGPSTGETVVRPVLQVRTWRQEYSYYIQIRCLWTIVALCLLFSQSANAAKGTMAGDLASDFVLQGLNGERVSLSSLSGTPVFLNFWATWCGPCKMEMPDMESLQKSLGDKVRILGINQGESQAKVEAFVRKYGYTWTFLTDTAKKVGEQYRISGYPTSVFIDADGRITGRRVGMMSGEEMERSIRAALGSEDKAFKLKFQDITRNIQNADVRIKSVEAGANIGTLTYVLEDGKSYEIIAFDRMGDSAPARQIELQIPSYDLQEVPVSDLHAYLLNWNLDYQAGAWAVDKHNNRLTLVARYGLDMLDETSFAHVCSEMVKTVSGFEKMINNLMAESQR